MAFEDIRAEIYLLLDRLSDQPEDIHELRMVLRERINELRATGMPLPDDLARLERELDADETGS